MFAGPDNAVLKLDVKCDKDRTILFEVQDNNWGAFPGRKKGQFYAPVKIKGSDQWQTISVKAEDFRPADKRTKHKLENWRYVTELGIRGRMAIEKDGKRVEIPENARKNSWTPPRPLRNLRWEGGTFTRTIRTPGGPKVMSEQEYKKQFQQGIDDSIRLEKRDRDK
jgi:hypothetical protein